MPRVKEGSPVKKRRSKKDPNAPKRGLSAFMFYSNEIRDTVKTEKPELTFLEIAGEIGKRWKALPEEKRKKFQKLAENDKKRYEAEKLDYVPDPSYEKTGKKKKDPNAPKRGLSGYMFYCNEFRAEARTLHPDKKITEIASILAEQWRNLDDTKRQKFQKLAEDDKLRYAREMEEWNASKN